MILKDSQLENYFFSNASLKTSDSKTHKHWQIRTTMTKDAQEISRITIYVSDVISDFSLYKLIEQNGIISKIKGLTDKAMINCAKNI